MKTNSNLLGIVVLFWNDSEKTIQCLNSLFDQKKQASSIILVDNDSDETYSKKIFNYLEKKKIGIVKIQKNSLIKKINSKKIYYLKNKINYGCGLGHNSGYLFCLKNNFRYIARIDNDMIVPKNLLFHLVQRLKNNKILAAISPKVMFLDNPKTIWFGGTKIGNNLKLQRECSNHICKKRDSSEFKGLIKTDAVVGCASVMRSEFLKKAGLSDPDFFYGEEDIELSQRLKKVGGSLAVDLNQKIYHSVSYTVNNNWAKTIYYNYKYRLVLIKKIGSSTDKIFGYSIFVIKLLLMTCLSFRTKYSSKIIQIFYAGLHFLQKKYGSFDRKNYRSIDNYFSKINKNTSIIDLIILINNEKKI